MKIDIYSNSIYGKNITNITSFFNFTLKERIKILLLGNLRYELDVEKLERYSIIKLDENIKESDTVRIY